MDVDARSAVCPFGHHPRDQRHVELVEQMGQAVDGHGIEAGIAEDHLVERLAGRIPVVRRPNVHGQDAAQLGQLIEEGDGLFLGGGFVVDLAFPLAGLVVREIVVMPHRPRDLPGQFVVQAVHEVADVEHDVPVMQVLAAAVTGEDDFLEVPGDLDDRFGAGKRAVAEVIDRADRLIRRHDAVGQFGKLLFAAQVGRHGSTPEGRAERCGKRDRRSQEASAAEKRTRTGGTGTAMESPAYAGPLQTHRSMRRTQPLHSGVAAGSVA